MCDQATVGVLTIALNNNIVSKALPACDSPNVYDVFKEDIRPGRNVLSVMLDRGNVELQQLRLKTSAEEVRPLIGYFNIDNTTMADIIDDVERVMLSIEFVGRDDKLYAQQPQHFP